MIFIALMVACRKTGQSESEVEVELKTILARAVAGTHADARMLAEEDVLEAAPESEGWRNHTVRIRSLEEILA